MSIKISVVRFIRFVASLGVVWVGLFFARTPVEAGDAVAVIPSPLRAGSIWELLNMVLDAVVLLVFPVVVLMIVYTGFLFVTAGGNEGQLTKARQALLWTVVGALVVLGAKGLALAIEATVEEIEAGVAYIDSDHGRLADAPHGTNTHL